MVNEGPRTMTLDLSAPAENKYDATDLQKTSARVH